MSGRPDPFDQSPPPGQWPRLELLAAPPHEALAEFIHGCAQDPADRTVAVTTLVMTLWQLAGRRMSHRLPSLVLVNANGDATDPNDLLASHLIAVPGCSSPRIYQEGHFMGGTPKHAPAAMINAIRATQKLGAPTPANASIYADLEQKYFDAQRTGFGCGSSRAYATAWHDAFGLITDRGGELILRLYSLNDRKSFGRDVLEEPDKVRTPAGYGSGLELVTKTTAVSGSIPIGMWDGDLASAAVELGLPIVILPSLTKEVPATDNLPVLERLATVLPESFHAPVVEPANFIPEPWFTIYRDELRRRLRNLPADYEYSIHKLARETIAVCERIAGWCGRGAPALEVQALWFELCMHTLRGITLSVAGLAWHVLGFDPGCPRAEALRVLAYLREKRTMTMAELRRNAHLSKELRDTLVDRFAAEGLAEVDGKDVTAVGYHEFVTGLYGRDELPPPIDLQEHLAELGKAAG